jgi:hypothetical protein
MLEMQYPRSGSVIMQSLTRVSYAVNVGQTISWSRNTLQDTFTNQRSFMTCSIQDLDLNRQWRTDGRIGTTLYPLPNLLGRGLKKSGRGGWESRICFYLALICTCTQNKCNQTQETNAVGLINKDEKQCTCSLVFYVQWNLCVPTPEFFRFTKNIYVIIKILVTNHVPFSLSL